MLTKIRLITYLSVSGFFLFLDQLFKYLARTNPGFTYYLSKPWLGWEYFGNTGIAFSLPFPNWLIIILTPLIILGLIYWHSKTKEFKHYQLLAISLIITGALSNYIDRILFGITIDYLRILTGVINLGDIIILGGIFLLLSNKNK